MSGARRVREFVAALMECSMQSEAREMLAIAVDPASDAQERDMAIVTLEELLFPSPAEDLEDVG